MKSPRFSPTRFPHSAVPEHFTLVLPSLSKNLRKLLKINYVSFEVLGKMKELTKRNKMASTRHKSVANPKHFLRYCKFLIKISVGMQLRWFEFVAGSCLCSKSSFYYAWLLQNLMTALQRLTEPTARIMEVSVLHR